MRTGGKTFGESNGELQKLYKNKEMVEKVLDEEFAEEPLQQCHSLKSADVVAMLKRPEDPDNLYKDKEMPPTSKKGEVLRSQLVYYKIRFDIGPTKPLLKAVDALRPKLIQGDIDSDRNRAVICGKDQTVYRMVDLLEGLLEDFIADLTRNQTPSQRSFIVEYCRKLLNGVGFLQGPAGSGKTTIMRGFEKIV